MATTYRVTLTPIEPLLFTDNRSARAGEDHLIQDQDPSPHTVYGAIGTYIAGRLGAKIEKNDWNQKVSPFLGEFEANLQSRTKDGSELLGFVYTDPKGKFWLPRPLHFRVSQMNRESTVLPSKPLEPAEQMQHLTVSSLTDFEDYLNGEYDEYEEELSDLISEDLLQKIFTMHSFSSTSTLESGRERLPLDELYRHEIRLGLGMSFKQNRTITGRLFSRPYRRFCSEVNPDNGNWQSVKFVVFYKTLQPINVAWMNQPGVACLGGDGGRTIIEFEKLDEKPLSRIMKAVQNASAKSKGFFCYLLTPAVREGGWPQLEGQEAIAAAIGKPQVVSGWNTEGSQHPRSILKLIPAGSTLFYRWPDDEQCDRKRFIEDHWLEPITRDTTNHYRNSGFGRILIGAWS